MKFKKFKKKTKLKTQQREREMNADGGGFEPPSTKTVRRKEYEEEIEGLVVKFPFEPYEVQRRFMAATIRAFKEVRIYFFSSYFFDDTMAYTQIRPLLFF